MMSAEYGRMELGKCVKIDYGYLGCSKDVLSRVDKLCSGRRTCNIRVPNTEMNTMPAARGEQECPDEFKLYLNVSYLCVQGARSAGCGCMNGSE